jgi:hypothetical protein
MNDAQDDGGQRVHQDSIAKRSNHLCVFSLCPVSHCGENPLSQLVSTITHKQKEQKQESEI